MAAGRRSKSDSKVNNDPGEGYTSEDLPGLATFFPAISAATCRQPGSKRLYDQTPRISSHSSQPKNPRARTHAISRPREAPGTIPGPPTRAAPMLLMMLPYKLGVTRTSNCWGLFRDGRVSIVETGEGFLIFL
jgi:hypothetical protein